MAEKVRVKICGITNKEDALSAVFYGASALGFVFYKNSPRFISPSRVRKIIEQLPPFVIPVGVFVNQKEGAIRDICGFTHIHTIQLHGEETPQSCIRLKDYTIIKGFRIQDSFDFNQVTQYNVDAYLFDAYQENIPGGTGKTFPWEILNGQKFKKPFILAGGLNKENISQALKMVSPYAVDISSAVEKSPGVKDARLIREFFDTLNSESFLNKG